MVEEINGVRLEEEDNLLRFDVVSIYTKILIDEAIETIKEITDEDTK